MEDLGHLILPNVSYTDTEESDQDLPELQDEITNQVENVHCNVITKQLEIENRLYRLVKRPDDWMVYDPMFGLIPKHIFEQWESKNSK